MLEMTDEIKQNRILDKCQTQNTMDHFHISFSPFQVYLRFCPIFSSPRKNVTTGDEDDLADTPFLRFPLRNEVIESGCLVCLWIFLCE